MLSIESAVKVVENYNPVGLFMGFGIYIGDGM
jgi:hypothetical protein